MSDAELLKSLVDEYELVINDVKFWTPYFINAQVHDNNKQPNLPAPHLGKGSAAEILAATKEALRRSGKTPTTPDGFRQFMSDHLIGVECSGFAYNIYAEFLNKKNLRLDDNLYWSRGELIAAFDNGIPWHRPELERRTVDAYPENIPLSRIASEWGWKIPRLLVRADRFLHPETTLTLESTSDLRPGDMVTMRESTGSGIGHLIIVMRVSSDIIQYAHSSRIDGTIGGVHYGEIQITNPELPIEEQSWVEKDFYDTHNEFALHRLKVLASD
jgi:hypothetical protein